MALEKTITQMDGIATTYHRVVRVEGITNDITLIEVGSYPSREVREMQLEDDVKRVQGERVDRQVYISTNFFQTDYTDGMTATDAYNFLKTLPEFEGATDVWEENNVHL